MELSNFESISEEKWHISGHDICNWSGIVCHMSEDLSMDEMTVYAAVIEQIPNLLKRAIELERSKMASKKI